MNFKHLFGFLFIIVGFSVAFLLCSFLLNSRSLSSLFLTALGISAFTSCFLGFFLLNKAH